RKPHVVFGCFPFADFGHCREHLDVWRRRRIFASSYSGSSNRPDSADYIHQSVERAWRHFVSELQRPAEACNRIRDPRQFKNNRKDFTIIGVGLLDFRGLNSMIQPALYVPRMMAEVLADPGVHPLSDRSLPSVDVYGRLKPGIGVEEARVEMARIGGQLEQENP